MRSSRPCCVGQGLTGRPRRLSGSGFTLLELTVVLAIVATVAVLVFPNLNVLSGYSLDSDAKRLSALIRHLSERASAGKVYLRLTVDPDRESVKVESSEDGKVFKDAEPFGLSLKEGTEIRDITVAGIGRVDTGEVAVVFNPGIGAEPFQMRLGRGERALTIKYNPYSGNVKVAGDGA